MTLFHLLLIYLALSFIVTAVLCRFFYVSGGRR